MMEKDFLSEIEHFDVPWKERGLSCPFFFYDAMSFGVYILAQIDRVKRILPSRRLHPFRVTPKQCIISIMALEYRNTDLGAYNEVSISIPCTLDKVSPLFTGTLRKALGIPKMYIHQLPVTTEVARDSGVDFAGYPKFLAEIRIEEKNETVSCRLSIDDKKIITLSVQKPKLETTQRTNLHMITHRNGYLLKAEFVLSKRETGVSKDSSDVRLDFGEHQIAGELRELGLGKITTTLYTPQFQAILTPSYESYAV
jgi:hypothetical protein